MNNRRNYIIGAAAIFLLLVLTMQDNITSIGSYFFFTVFTLLAILFPFVCIGAIGYFVYKYLRDNKNATATPNINIQNPSTSSTKELTESLDVAFKRNNTRQLQHTLTKLPSWPISQRIQQTAQELIEFKRSIYRAQAEGVPASMIERHLQNMHQAAGTVWQIASKVDAVGLQNVPYNLVAPRLDQEELKLQQLQQAIKDSHQGIALLILSGTKSDVLQEVEDDLRSPILAIKSLELVQLQQRLP